MKKETVKQLREKVVLGYDEFAKDWDTTRRYAWPEFEMIKSKLKKNLKVLDLGCGNGRFFEICEKMGVEYVGLDNSKKLIELAKKNYPKGKFLVGDALSLPFENENFDLVVSFAVVHHVPAFDNQIKFMDEVARVLRKNGEFFVTTWNIFQPKYKRYIWLNRLRKLSLRSDLGWNDALIPFGEQKIERYVHAFTPDEMRKLLRKKFAIEEEYFTQKEARTGSWRKAYNLCWLAKKI